MYCLVMAFVFMILTFYFSSDLVTHPVYNKVERQRRHRSPTQLKQRLLTRL